MTQINGKNSRQKKNLEEDDDLSTADFEEQNSPKKRTESEAGPFEKPDWKKVKLEKKELRFKRKQAAAANNDVYDLSVKMLAIWEELRRSDCKQARKTELCKELYNLIEGKVKNFIFAHDTVRVIETLLTVGKEDYRSKLFVELKEEIVELIRNKYSRFFIVKMLRYGTRDQKNIIIKAMYGQVVQLMRHKIACDVVEQAYNDHATAQQRSYLMQEFYGPKFRHFKDKNIHSLSDALKIYDSNKKSILSEISKELQPIIEKGVFTNTMIHTLMKEFLYNCGDADRKIVIDSVKEKLLPIIHTRDGARVAMMCLWYSPTKDRKTIIKSMKGHFQKIASEEHGFMILLAVFDSVDDTVLVSKTIIAELTEDLNKLVASESGKKVLTYLVAPRNKMFFHPDVINILSKGDGNPFTKKPRETILKQLQDALNEPLLKLVDSHITEWCRDSKWTLLVGSVLKNFSGNVCKDIFEKLAVVCATPYIPDDEETHFLDLSHTTKLITFIIQSDHERFKQNQPVFSTLLLEVAESEIAGWILTNRSCFLLVKLIETMIPEVVEAVTKQISSCKAKLRKYDFAGARILLEKLK